MSGTRTVSKESGKGDAITDPRKLHLGDAVASGRRTFAPARITIAAERVLRVQGYGTKRKIPAAVLNAADSMADVAGRVARPDARYRRLAIEALLSDGTLRLAGGTELRSPAFNRHLAGCREAVLFVLTLGGGLDLVERNLNAAGSLLEAVLLESAAWMTIEHATKELARHVAAQVAADGLALTRRMAPGYGFSIGGQKMTWPLQQQAQLFAALGPGPLPVELLASGGMLPKMSRSGLWGLRPHADRPAGAAIDE